MNASELRNWLRDRLKEAQPIDEPPALGNPAAVAVEATKKLCLTGYGSGEMLTRGGRVRTVEECAEILADCLAALPPEEVPC